MAFDATIETARGGGHLVAVPAEVAAQFTSRRPAVVAHVNGVEYRSRLAVYGGVSYLGLRKDLLARLGVDVGDRVEVSLATDESPRTVELPAELAAALAGDPQAAATYEGLAFTHRREYATWVAEAKKSETRKARAGKAVQMLREGRHR